MGAAGFHGRLHGGHGGAALVTLGVGIIIGTVIASLPRNHSRVSGEIYISDGIYYRRIPTGYRVIEAPRGPWIKDIPQPHRIAQVKAEEYFVSHGTWYKFDPARGQYQVVEKPSH